MYDLFIRQLLDFAMVIGCFTLAIIAVCIFGFAFLGLTQWIHEREANRACRYDKLNDETKGEN